MGIINIKNDGKNNQPKKILLVEDNRVNLLVMERYLLRWGYGVKAAINGMAALKLAAVDAFDLILMNLKMPGISGRETSKLIRNLNIHYQATPIVAFSSDLEQLLQCPDPFTDFLQVPYAPEQLKNILELHMPQASVVASNLLVHERLDTISKGDELYRRQLVSLYLKNCAELLEDLQMGRLESPAYLEGVRHKHKSSFRLLGLFSLETALDDMQEALTNMKLDRLVLQFRKRALVQQIHTLVEDLNLILA